MKAGTAAHCCPTMGTTTARTTIQNKAAASAALCAQAPAGVVVRPTVPDASHRAAVMTADMGWD